MSEAEREVVAVYGGSFDPPHVAHVLVVAWVLTATEADRVLVVPAYQHPLGKEARTAYEHRVHMCELAVADLARVEVSRIEEQLGGDSRTLRTLEALGEQMPEARFRFVMGADLLDEVSEWHRFDLIEALAPPLIVGRAGYPGPEGTVALPGVSSTDLRERLHSGQGTEGLLHRDVATYIHEHGLYPKETSP